MAQLSLDKHAAQGPIWLFPYKVASCHHKVIAQRTFDRSEFTPLRICIHDDQSFRKLNDGIFSKDLGRHRGGYFISFQSKNSACPRNQIVTHCPELMEELCV